MLTLNLHMIMIFLKKVTNFMFFVNIHIQLNENYKFLFILLPLISISKEEALRQETLLILFGFSRLSCLSLNSISLS